MFYQPSLPIQALSPGPSSLYRHVLLFTWRLSREHKCQRCPWGNLWLHPPPDSATSNQATRQLGKKDPQVNASVEYTCPQCHLRPPPCPSETFLLAIHCPFIWAVLCGHKILPWLCCLAGAACPRKGSPFRFFAWANLVRRAATSHPHEQKTRMNKRNTM